MAYLIFIANGEEYDRRELRGAILLGRAPDCDLAIPDITLSRHHCRVEPSENGRGWQLIDLHSKNGTQFRGQNIESHVLRDGDELRIGRTRLTFKVGKFVKAAGKSRPKAVIRAVDPHEALSGTVSGMVVCEPGETAKHEGMPVPQPRPLDPNSYENDDVYGMINEIASSSFDSTHAQNSKPVRMQRAAPVPGVTQAEKSRSQPRVSFELQADHSESQVGMTSSEITSGSSLADGSISGGSISGGSISGRSMSARSIAGAARSRNSRRSEPAPLRPAPLRPAPLLAPVHPDRRPRLIIGAAAAIAAVVCVATWAMLVRGHDDANPTDSLISVPAAQPTVDSAPAQEPIAMTAGAVNPGIDSNRTASSPSPASPRPARQPKNQFKRPTRAAIPVPPAEKLDHLTTFELIFPATAKAAQHPRPTDIAPDDLLGPSSVASHPDPLGNR